MLKFNFSSGKSGVKYLKGILSRTSSGDLPLIFDTSIKAKYFSFSFGGLILPNTVSPVFNPNNLIWDGETYISSGLAR